MRDPIVKNSGNGRLHGNDDSSNNRAHRDNYCWKFNRNKCKFGSKCRYEHHCNYCDGYGHGAFNCNRNARNKERKLEKFNESRNVNDKSDKK